MGSPLFSCSILCIALLAGSVGLAQAQDAATSSTARVASIKFKSCPGCKLNHLPEARLSEARDVWCCSIGILDRNAMRMHA
jgi:hypothetical protein